MTEPGEEFKAKDSKANRILFWSFLAALIVMPPLNKYVAFPLADRLVEAPGSITAFILGGAMSGAVLGGLIWLIGWRVTRHRRKGNAQ